MHDPNDITVIVVTYNRPDKCRRAVNSIIAQTQPCRVLVANDGSPLPREAYAPACYYQTGRPDHWYLSVYDAIHRSNTPFVTVLCDDDYLQPTFLETCCSLMDDGAGYVVTEAMAVYGEGKVKQNYGFSGEPSLVDALQFAEYLLGSPGIITPSTCLYRREDALRSLTPGGVPGFISATPWLANESGPDHLMALLPLLWHETVGVVPQPLAVLDGWSESTTVSEYANDGGVMLNQNYSAARALLGMLLSYRDDIAMWPRVLHCPSCGALTERDPCGAFGCGCGAMWSDR